MHNAGYGGVLALRQRINFKTWMIVFLLAAHRQKLPADWIILRVRPIDPTDHVRIETDRHAGSAQTGFDLIHDMG